MPDGVVRELEVYKMLARLGIELGAGVIPRYGLMSVTVPLTLDEGTTSIRFALCHEPPEFDATHTVDKEIDPAFPGVLSAITRKH
jgi:hypothetical protein